MQLVRLVHSAEEAGEEIARFYRNFHSTRWLNGNLLIRMTHPLNDGALQTLNKEFADLCLSGSYQQQPCCEAENDEPEFRDMTRLAFHFNARDHGRLREEADRRADPAARSANR